MLSYRHAFHAGNHADILKHFCLFETLNYFVAKDKPFAYIDTHSGAGIYDLQSAKAQTNLEYQTGVAKLALNAELAPFMQLFKTNLAENFYPGSPWIAWNLMPAKYPLFLYELHPQDFTDLSAHFQQYRAQQVHCFQTDGLQGLLAQLPPQSRRAVVLIDPSYELKEEYQKVCHTLKKALKKFSTGCYLIWYPCLNSVESQQFPKDLEKLSKKYLSVELQVKNNSTGFGMFGSGIWIINPPYTLADKLKIILPQLVTALKQDNSAKYLLKVGEL